MKELIANHPFGLKVAATLVYCAALCSIAHKGFQLGQWLKVH